MSTGFILQFENTSIATYDATTKELGLRTGSNENWPAGMVSHTAGLNGTTLCVVDVWESEAVFAQYRQERLGPALAKTGMPMPKVTKFDVHNKFPQ